MIETYVNVLIVVGERAIVGHEIGLTAEGGLYSETIYGEWTFNEKYDPEKEIVELWTTACQPGERVAVEVA